MRWRAAAPLLGCAVIVAAGMQQQSAGSRWNYSARVTGIAVTDSAGREISAPFLGGFDLPRPSLVDINGDGRLDLFVQERTGDLIYFERVGDTWEWRADRFHDLNIGEWYRFADVDRDGDQDLLTEMIAGYIRVWRNDGTTNAPRFVAMGDTVRDVDGLAIPFDRQNILNAVDIDCNNRIDLFIGKVQGTVDRYEHDGQSPDGSPRFRLLEEMWQGIEVIGPETPGGMLRVDTIVRRGPAAYVDSTRLHGANTLAFADVDGKGTLDLFWGDFFEQGLLRFHNSGSCAQPDLSGGHARFPKENPLLTSGYNAPTFGDVDGDSHVDMVMGVIGGAYQPSRTAIENLYLMRQAPKGTWTVTTKRIVASVDVGSDAVPALADVTGDSLLDLIVGSKLDVKDDATGTLTWFENVGTASRPAFRERGMLPIRGEYSYAPAVLDVDGDGLEDLVLGSWRDRIQLYRNTGSASAPRWTLADSTFVMITRGTNTVPSFGDLDGDGLADLAIGEGSGTINMYRNVGSRGAPKFELVSDQFQDIKVGRRSAPHIVDMDRDGRLDMLIGNADGELQLWRGVGARGEIRFERDTAFRMRSFPSAAPSTGDLFGRGALDVIVGVASGGLRWFEPRVAR